MEITLKRKKEYHWKQLLLLLRNADYINKNEIIPLAATWMHLEIILLSKVIKKEKDKYDMISLIGGL